MFYGLLTSALTVLVLAHNSVTFLVGWEGMAISAFFLVGTQDEKDDVREAAWLYLAASHAATLALFMMFALMYGATGNYDLVPLSNEALGAGNATIVFLLALAGFGLKAGLMPLHFWLPSAHAMAPSYVSAVMSGVMIKAGIYGLVRMTWVLAEPPLWWGRTIARLRGRISRLRGSVRAGTTRYKKAAGVSQHREHWDHCDWIGAGDDWSNHERTDLDPSRTFWLPFACLKSRSL